MFKKTLIILVTLIINKKSFSQGNLNNVISGEPIALYSDSTGVKIENNFKTHMLEPIGNYNSISDIIKIEEENDFKTFKLLHRPSSKNNLAKILHENISEQELAGVKFKIEFPNLKNTIRAYFKTNQKGDLTDISINVGYKKLNTKLENIVRNYLSSKILKNKQLKSTSNYLQLFSKQGGTTIIEPSSIMVTDHNSFYKGKSSHQNIDVFLNNFFSKKIEITEIENELPHSGVYFRVNFELKKEGKIENPQIISNHSEDFKTYVSKILQQIDVENLKPTTRNGIPIDSKISCPIHLRVVKKKWDTKEVEALTDNIVTKRFKEITKINSVAELQSKNKQWEKQIVYFTFNNKDEIYNTWVQERISNFNQIATNGYLKSIITKLFDQEFIKTLKLDTSIDKIYSIKYFWRNSSINFIYNGNIDWCSIGYYKKCPSCKNIIDLAKFNSKEVNIFILKELQKTFKDYKISEGKSNLYTQNNLEEEVIYKKNSQNSFNLIYNTTINYFPIIFSKEKNTDIQSFSSYYLFDHYENSTFYGVTYTGNIESSKENPNYSIFKKKTYITKEKEELDSKIREILSDKILFERSPMINGKTANSTLPSLNIKFKYSKEK